MGDQTPTALVPGMCSLDDPALGLNHEALGNLLGPQRLLRVLPGAGAAIAGVANDLDGDAVSLNPAVANP